MRKKYSSATRVIVWLGLDDNGLAGTAAHAMNEIARSICIANSKSVSDLWDIHYLKTLAMNSISWRELSCNTPDIWNSLSWFFSRPWFVRVWVYQEISGPKVLFLCGEVELDWDIVGLTAEYITISRSLFDTYDFWKSNIWCAAEQRDRRFLDDSCLDLLYSARRRKATNLVDKVYGLLGMPNFSVQSLGLSANYDKSVAEVYQDMGDTALASLRNLDLLAFVQHDREISQHYPSWIPRWDQANLRHPLIRELRFQSAHNASQGLIFTYERDRKDTVLKVPGIWFDTIKTERSIDSDAWFTIRHRPLNPHPILEFWLEDKTRPSFYPTGERSIDVYPEVLTTGFGTKLNRAGEQAAHQQADFSAYIVQLMKSSRHSISEYTSLHEQGQHGNWESWESVARVMTWGHSFFTTTKGYMGLGSQAMKAGNVVSVLTGGEVPFILRRAGNFFQLVGECYVYGIMNGEAVHNSARREIFQIQ